MNKPRLTYDLLAKLVERNRQLEAAVTQLAALAPCDCDSRLPIRTHEAISNCPHLKAAAIVKALKEKAVKEALE